MKPFDIEKAKQGHPVQTRDGHDVELLKFDIRSAYPIVGIVKYLDFDMICTWDKDGNPSNNQPVYTLDLFLKSRKKEGWVNVYARNSYPYYNTEGIYETKEKAICGSMTGRIGTVKIEWEE